MNTVMEGITVNDYPIHHKALGTIGQIILIDQRIILYIVSLPPAYVGR